MQNSLGQEIKNPENFKKWFGNSVTVDEQGRPLVFYHGTRADFTEFKTGYSDNLIFFSYEKKFADDWGKSKKGYSNELSNEIFDKLRVFRNNLFKKYQAKYGEEFYTENEEMDKQYHKEVDEYEEQLEKERNVHNRTLGCYLKVHKIFVPERDYELVLDEICEYHKFTNPYTPEYEKKLKEFEDKYDAANKHWDEWWANNKDAEEEVIRAEEKKLDLAFREFSVYRSIKNSFDNHLDRIKKGAWIYFEHGNVIDKIWSLGYDAIQLSEAGGEQTTIAVRAGNNQIKSVDNNGNWSGSENIYERLEVLDSCFVTASPYDIANLIKNKPKEYRILYDENIDMYMIGDANEVTHWDMLRQAYKDAYYYNLEYFIDSLGTFENYVEVGQDGGYDENDEEIEPYLYYIVFTPEDDWTLGTDGYNKKYDYSFGHILTRGCDFKELTLYNILHEKKLNEDYYEQFENTNEITHFEILQEFDNKRSSKIEWNVIPAKPYYNALKQYHRDGEFFKFPERTIQEWLDLVCENSIRFELLNDFWCLYDGDENALRAIDIMYGNGEEELTCEQATKILEDVGFYDWARLPDGSEGYSDQMSYVGILSELDEFPTKEEMLVTINRCIDVWHQRGDMAAMLIEGGRDTARKISLGTLDERFEEIERNVYATNSGYDIINRMKNKPQAYRMIWDNNIKYYFIGDAFDYIHEDILEHAYYNGFYPKMLSANECDDYINTNMETNNIVLFAFDPKGGGLTDNEKSSDGYTRKYVYDFGTIYAHEFTPFESCPLYTLLGEPLKIEAIFENYLEENTMLKNNRTFISIIEKLKKIIIEPQEEILFDDMEDETGLNIKECMTSAQLGPAPTPTLGSAPSTKINGTPVAGKSVKRKKTKKETDTGLLSTSESFNEENKLTIDSDIASWLDKMDFKNVRTKQGFLYKSEGNYTHWFFYNKLRISPVIRYVIEEGNTALYNNIWFISDKTSINDVLTQIERMYDRYE